MRLRMVVLFVALMALSEEQANAGWEDAEECVNAKQEAESSAQQLASDAQALAYCAEAEDFDDDCSSEYYSVSSAHGDYESAVSEVESYCN